jgi:hypothetical protein
LLKLHASDPTDVMDDLAEIVKSDSEKAGDFLQKEFKKG